MRDEKPVTAHLSGSTPGLFGKSVKFGPVLDRVNHAQATQCCVMWVRACRGRTERALPYAADKQQSSSRLT
jgi:hypothetical protein